MVDGVDLVEGIFLYSGSSVAALQVLDCDARKVDEMFPAVHPSDVAT